MEPLEFFAEKLEEHEALLKELNSKCEAYAEGQRMLFLCLVHLEPKIIPILSDAINAALDDLEDMDTKEESGDHYYSALQSYLKRSLQFLKQPPEGRHLRLVKPKPPLAED